MCSKCDLKGAYVIYAAKSQVKVNISHLEDSHITEGYHCFQ